MRKDANGALARLERMYQLAKQHKLQSNKAAEIIM